MQKKYHTTFPDDATGRAPGDIPPRRAVLRLSCLEAKKSGDVSDEPKKLPGLKV